MNGKILLCEGNLLGLPVVYWPDCEVACYDHKFAGAGTENLMGFISPAALQQVAGERNIAAFYYQVDIPIIRNQTISQPVVDH